jgi:hypothetical protein
MKMQRNLEVGRNETEGTSIYAFLENRKVRSAVMNKGTEWIEWLSLKMHRREGK